MRSGNFLVWGLIWIFSTVLYFCRSPVCCEQHLLSFLRVPNLLIPAIIFTSRQYQCQSHSLVITFGTAAHSAGSCWVGYENSPGAAFKARVSVAWWSASSLNFYCFVGEIPVAVLRQTLLLYGEGIESWVGVFSFLSLWDCPLFLNLQILLPSKGNFTALLTPCGHCSTTRGLC